MCYTPAVAILNAFKNLFEYSFSIEFFKPSIRLGFKIAVKTRPSHVFHDQDHIFRGVDDLIEADDVLVLHFFHEFDLTFHRFASVWIKQLVLLVDFHSYFFISRLVKAHSDDGISTLTDLFSNDIVIKRALVGEDH